MDKNIITLSEEDIQYIVRQVLNEGKLARFLGTAALGGALALGGVPAQAQQNVNGLEQTINAEKRDSIDSRIGDNKVLVNSEPIDVENLINLLNNKFNSDGYTVKTNINNNSMVFSKGHEIYENQQSLNININYSNVIKTNFSKEKMKDMFKHFRDDTIWHWNDIIKYEETTNGILISMPNKYNGIKYYTKIYLKDAIFKIEISVSANLPIGWYNKHNISIERLEQIKTISEKCINALTGKERYDTEWDF